MKPDVRTRRALALAAVMLAAAIMLPRFLTHTPYPRLGADVGRAGDVQAVVGPPARGLLAKGDTLVAINGIALGDSVARSRMPAKSWPRETLALTVRRDGQNLTLQVPPVRLSPWQRLRLWTYPIAAVIAAPLVAFLLVWRRPDLTSAWVFLWFAALQGAGVIFRRFHFAQGDLSPTFELYLRGYEWLTWFYPASFVHFMCMFPRPRWKLGQHLRNPWFWLTVAAYATPFVMHAVSRALLQDSPPSEWADAFEAVALVVGTGSLLERYSREGPDWRPTNQQRLLALLVAVVLLASAAFNVLVLDPRLLDLVPDEVMRVLFPAILIAWLSTPLVIAYLIADDPLFDPRRLVVGGLPYALLSGLLAAIYLGVVLAGQRVFASLTGEQALAFNVVAALVVAFAFAPLRERVQRTINRVYGRDPEALRAALDQAGRDLLSALDRGEVRRAVEQGVARGLRRPRAIEWPEDAAPRLADPEEAPEHARGALETLLAQAGIRLENLALAAERANAARQAVEMREAATRAELRALQAQVQPHFLFNALNALAYLIETDPSAAQRFTERLADMLRYAVQAGQRPAALLSDEIAFVEDYLGVARERYENPLVFEFRGGDDLLSSSVPPLVLQPLVENSLKHGLAPGADSLHMTLEARLVEGRFEMEFADDGTLNGRGAPGLGVGLENLEQRVRRFAGPDARVTAGPRAGGGFVVQLSWLVPAGGIS